jgi:uncharacterized protein with GYD domain
MSREDIGVSTYVALLNWTDQGMRNIRDSPKRLDAANKLLAEMEGAVKAFYMTMGHYDMVLVYEAPDDAVAARFTLKLGQDGNIRTQTLKAFPEQAFREIIASV